jgi:hypothetical protein
MMMFVVIGAAVLAIVAVVWSDMAQRVADDIDPAIEQRALRFETLAATAADLQVVLGREPSVREIYTAIDSADGEEGSANEPDEIETDPVIDLRARVLRIKESQAESPVA